VDEQPSPVQPTRPLKRRLTPEEIGACLGAAATVLTMLVIRDLSRSPQQPVNASASPSVFSLGVWSAVGGIVAMSIVASIRKVRLWIAGAPSEGVHPDERPGGRCVTSEQLMDPEEAKQRGYHSTPGGQQWSPNPKEPVDKSRWKPCRACGRLIPVVEDRITRISEIRTAGQRTSDPDGTVIEEGVSYSVKGEESTCTWTYVCPICGHADVGTPGDSPDLRAQAACHQCGEELGASVQCPKCTFPRGWMTVQCPYCGNRQPVYAPHWVVSCDMYTLECVKCESRFDSFCIC
jgi:hypothetical protein